MVVMFLLGWKLKHDEVAEAADAPAAPGRADGVRRVLDHPQPVACGDRVEALHVDRQAGKVHRHDRARARGDRRLTWSRSMLRESRPTSTNTGRAPTRTITLAVATKLSAGVMTSSPGPMPQASSAISSPAVAEVCVRTGRPPR